MVDIENNDDDNKYEGESTTKYSTIRGTYKLISFAMAIGMIYPNPETDRRRLLCIGIMILSIAPISSMIMLDMYESWLRRDIINVIRHSTVVGPFLAIFAKMFIMFYKRVPSKQLIDEMDRDYAMYNHLPASYRRIVDKSIHSNLVYSEMCWVVTVVTCVMTFPLMATAGNIYNFLFKSEPTKYMIHDMNKPFAPPEDRFQSPYFEFIYGYMIYCGIFYVTNFIGYDGFFGLCVNHACLKIRLYCKAFEDAMSAKSEEELWGRLIGVIEEQNKLSEFVDLIQNTFNIWLGLILIATMIQICNCMYHITEGYELDLRYIIFILGTIVHIYLPCRYSAKLKHETAQTATAMYCAGWERARAAPARRCVQFMIARAQRPLEITGFYMFVFDMDLFVSILQTSYSMYTLLRS